MIRYNGKTKCFEENSTGGWRIMGREVPEEPPKSRSDRVNGGASCMPASEENIPGKEQ